jgi:ribosomal protein S18 acetylase RimI-like enzyme
MIEIESGCSGRPGLASLESTDTELVTGFFQRLSAETVYRRFFSPISRPERFAASILNIDHHDHEAIAAVENGELVGIAQYSRAPGSREANLAIVVADNWHQQGIGTRLVAALADRAMAHGIEAFAVDIQGDNYGALRLLRRINPEVRLKFASGVGEGVIPLR